MNEHFNTTKCYKSKDINKDINKYFLHFLKIINKWVKRQINN